MGCHHHHRQRLCLELHTACMAALRRTVSHARKRAPVPLLACGCTTAAPDEGDGLKPLPVLLLLLVCTLLPWWWGDCLLLWHRCCRCRRAAASCAHRSAAQRSITRAQGDRVAPVPSCARCAPHGGPIRGSQGAEGAPRHATGQCATASTSVCCCWGTRAAVHAHRHPRRDGRPAPSLRGRATGPSTRSRRAPQLHADHAHAAAAACVLNRGIQALESMRQSSPSAG